MVNAPQIVRLRAIVGTLLHINGEHLSQKKKTSMVDTYAAFSLRKGWQIRKELLDLVGASSISTMDM